MSERVTGIDNQCKDFQQHMKSMERSCETKSDSEFSENSSQVEILLSIETKQEEIKKEIEDIKSFKQTDVKSTSCFNCE